jgi:hypothetical protein
MPPDTVKNGVNDTFAHHAQVGLARRSRTTMFVKCLRIMHRNCEK